MTPRRTHITVAALAIASLVIGVVALRSLSDVPERSAVTPTSRDIRVANGPVASPAATGGASGLAAPFLPGLRGHITPESEPSPPAGTMALVENPQSWSSPNGAPAQAQADAPLPPKRPADLANREASPATPLPPPRPAGLTKDGEAAPPREQAVASPLAQLPAAVAAPAETAVANVPLPPSRPRALAALTPPSSASAPESPPVPPAPVPVAPDLAAPAPAPCSDPCNACNPIHLCNSRLPRLCRVPWLQGGVGFRSLCRVYAYYVALWWLRVALPASSGLSPNDNQRACQKRLRTWRVCPEAGDAHHGHARPSSRPRETAPRLCWSLPIVPRCSSSAGRAQRGALPCTLRSKRARR